MTKNDTDSGKPCTILSYFVVGIIWFFADQKMRKNEFAEYHAEQALVLILVSIIINVVGSVIPIIGWFVILPLGSIFVLFLWIMGLINSLSGKRNPLFLIGKWAENWKF